MSVFPLLALLRGLSWFYRKIKLRFLLSYLVVSALIAGTLLFIFLNDKPLFFGHDLADLSNFVILAIILLIVLFLALLFFFHLVGFYIYALNAFFVSCVFFVFSNWGSITFDYATFLFIILFTAFGIAWQLYFFLSFKKYSWQRTSLLQIWKFSWKENIFILKLYLVLFLFAWVFFLFGDLGNTLLGWINISIERNYFSPIGRTMLMLVFISFLIKGCLFILLNLVLFFSWDDGWKQHLLRLGSFYFLLSDFARFRLRLLYKDFCAFSSQRYCRLRFRFRSARASVLLWTKIKSFFIQGRALTSKTLFPIKDRFDLFVLGTRRWRSLLFFSFLLFLFLAVTFFALAFDAKVPFWQKPNVSLWKKTDLSVEPLVNQYDRQSYLEYLVWEGQRLKLSKDFNLFDVDNFRVVPIIENNGKWSYGVNFLQPLSAQSEQFLKVNNFVKVSSFEQYLLTIWFDLRWLLIFWAFILALFVVLLTTLLGLEYGFVFTFGSALRLFTVLTLCFVIDNGLTVNFLKMFLFLIPVDCFLTFYLYMNYSQSQKTPKQFLFAHRRRFYLFFLLFAIVVWTLIYALLGYSWTIFVPLFLICCSVYFVSFMLNLFLASYLKKYKVAFLQRIKRKLFATYTTSQSESVISQLND